MICKNILCSHNSRNYDNTNDKNELKQFGMTIEENQDPPFCLLDKKWFVMDKKGKCKMEYLIKNRGDKK